MAIFDVTLTVNMTFAGLPREEVLGLVDKLDDALADRTDNGAVSVDFNDSTVEVEVIVRNKDVDLGAAIARRIVLDALDEANIVLESVQHTEQQGHTLVAA